MKLMMNDWPVTLKLPGKHKVVGVLVRSFVGLTSRLFSRILNKTRLHNHDQFMDLVLKRPAHKPLVTVCNHDSCCDDPIVFGAALPVNMFTSNKYTPQLRWSLGAREICHSVPWHAFCFRLGKVLPIDRGHGVYQPSMNEVVEELDKGAWVHIFPEGRVNEKKEFIRLKWGVGRLVADSKVTPTVLPFYHLGCDDVLPNQAPYRPKTGQKITILFGKPMNFDDLVKTMKEQKKTAVEIRKKITDMIQDEMEALKVETQKLHQEYLKS